MNTQRQSGRVAIKIDNIENKTNNFNQSEDSKNTKFIYYTVSLITSLSGCLVDLFYTVLENTTEINAINKTTKFVFLIGLDVNNIYMFYTYYKK